MWIFLTVVILFARSRAEDRLTVSVSDSVILPCTCADRNLTQEFRWQKEEPIGIKVFNGVFSDGYKGRAEVFVNLNSSNCSLRLTNVTADDNGTYRCSFFEQSRYKPSVVHLTVYANITVCSRSETLDGDPSVTVVQCDAVGRHQEVEIQWYLDEERLTNSSTTNVTHTAPVSAPADLHRVQSKLFTRSNRASEIKCVVKAERISLNSLFLCTPVPEPEIQIQEKYFFTLIPLVMVSGLSLVMWLYFKCSRRSRLGVPR